MKSWYEDKGVGENGGRKEKGNKEWVIKIKKTEQKNKERVN